MIQTIVLTFVVCGSLISVAERGKWNDKVDYIPATFIMVPSLEEKSILVRDNFDWTLSSSISMGVDDFPRTTCKDFLGVVRIVLTKSTHPP